MPHGINVVFYINQNKFLRDKQKMFMTFLDVKRNILRNVEVTEDIFDLNTGKVEINVTINPIEVNSISLHIDSGYGKLYKINEFYISNTRPRYTDIFNVKRVSYDPIDCEIIDSASQCVPICTPANQTNGTRFRYRVENIKTFPDNGGLSCPLDINDYPNTSETIVEECEQKICNDCYGYWSEYSHCDFRTRQKYKKYIVVNPGEFGGQPCDTINGDVMTESCEPPHTSTDFVVIPIPVRQGNIFKVGEHYYGIVYPNNFKHNITLFGTQKSDGTVDPTKSCIVTARDENGNFGAITFTPITSTGGVFNMSITEDEIAEENHIKSWQVVKPVQHFIQYPRILIYRGDRLIFEFTERFNFDDLKHLYAGTSEAHYRILAVQTSGFDVKERDQTEYVRKTEYTVVLETREVRNANCLSWESKYAPAPLARAYDIADVKDVPDNQKWTYGIRKSRSSYSRDSTYNTSCYLYSDDYFGDSWYTKIKWDKN